MKKITLVLYFLICTTSPFAFAGHPFVTDDAETMDQGGHKIEINTDWLKEWDGSHGQVSGFSYAYGLIENLEFFIDTGVDFKPSSGMPDPTVGLKWRFWNKDAHSFSLNSSLTLPTGKVSKGLSNGRSNLELVLIHSYEYESWAIHNNLSLSTNRFRETSDQMENRNSLWRASLAVSRKINDEWQLISDAGITRNSNIANRSNPAYLLMGVIYSPNETVDIDFGAKFGLNKAETKRQLGVGLTFNY